MQGYTVPSVAQTSPRDPRFLPFRAAAYAVYFVLVGGFCSLLIYSVLQSVSEMSPDPLPPSEQVLNVRECVEGAQGLFTQLESEREGFLRGGSAVKVDERWAAFRTRWLTDFRQLESRCAPDGTRSRKQLRPLFKQLQRLQELYAVHATHFAQSPGPQIEAFRTSLQAARKDPSFGRLP